MSDEIGYFWRGPISDDEMVELVESHGGRPDAGWWERPPARSRLGHGARPLRPSRCPRRPRHHRDVTLAWERVADAAAASPAAA
jgi:hypothetical protein